MTHAQIIRLLELEARAAFLPHAEALELEALRAIASRATRRASKAVA